MNYLIIAIRYLWSHKLKITATFWLAVIFAVLLFPLNDLNDLVTAQVSKLTNKNVFVQFENISLNPFGPKLTLDKVFVETKNLPPLTTDSFSVMPSFGMLVSRQPEGSLSAQGFMKGDVQISVRSGPKSEAGVARSKIEVQAKDLNLKDIRDFASLPVPLLGKITLNSTALADLTFTEQPEMDLNVNILRFEMPGAAVPVGDMGPLNLPMIKMSLVELKGKLAAGKFTIESGKLGTANDEFFGDIKGEFGLTFMLQNGNVVPILGAYDLDLTLKATPAFREKAKFFLNFIDGYRTDLATGSQYKFKLKANAVGIAPQITSLR